MRKFFAQLSLVLTLGLAPAVFAAPGETTNSAASPAPSGESATFVAGVSPFLDAGVKDAVYRGLVRLIVQELPLNSTLEIYDAYNLKSITRLTVPDAKVFNSPKTRANQFAAAIGEIKEFLAKTNPKPAGPAPGFDGAIALPEFCDFLSHERHRNGRIPVLLLGSPLYQDAREPSFSMVDGYFPSDGHLRVSREESIYGLNSGDSSSQPLLVYWAYFGEPWVSDLHREKVTRFWTLYLERRGGRVASFSSDLQTAIGAFSSRAQGEDAASKGWALDASQNKPEMVRVTRNMGLTDWLTGEAPSSQPPPPSRMTGPIKIGIRWKQNIDLDLYATPRRGAETLFFQHARSPEGYYFKDHRSSPGKEYEFIEFETPVDVREARAYVNFYGGNCAESPSGEVRIEFMNRVYRSEFTVEATSGNQGRTGKSQSEYWTELPIREILRIRESDAQAAAAR
jgi:hypothetical protein